MEEAARSYAARLDAVLEQRTRLRGVAPPDVDPWGGRWAQGFSLDPHRSLDENLAVLASYVQPDDVLIDVGGGAGRLSLPLALRCREVVAVDASPGMATAFLETARSAGLENVRFVQGEWLQVEGVQGTIALAANVIYFAREIVPFVRRLEACAPRRVMITVWSWPPPSRNAELFRLVYGEEEVRVPGHRELLPVLWEMNILPDVRLLPLAPQALNQRSARTRDEAPAAAADMLGNEQWAHWPVSADLHERVRRVIAPRFEEFFEETPDGFRPRWTRPARELLITWEPGR
jgi:SAM-dependent methyltransferase